MSGGITDPPKPKLKAHYEVVVQGSTAKELKDSLADLPDDAYVTFVDSYTEDAVTWGQEVTTTAGIGFKWAASPTP